MKFVKKSDYVYDLRIFKDWNARFWYALLGVLVVSAPLWLTSYMLA